MRKSQKPVKKGRWKTIFLSGIIFGVLLILGSHRVFVATSSNAYCSSCHSHPRAESSWKLSTHHNNNSGIKVNCVDCHLPPGGIEHVLKKVEFGFKDVYGEIFKDPEKINWEEKSQPDHAVKFTFQASCTKCHQNIFPMNLSKEGEKAHLYYNRLSGKLHCINCHLNVGHYTENPRHARNVQFGKSKEIKTFFQEAASVDTFANFTETIPGTAVKFEMIAIKGGSFIMGSNKKDPYKKEDEQPAHNVTINDFFLEKTEVSWNEFLAFYNQTASEGRPEGKINNNNIQNADAISGATPPYGPPDQGWGMGNRPAITMTHHAAQVYCKWLSLKTGKKYRLPTEAEWEYACRAGTTGPNFLNISPKKLTEKRIVGKIFDKKDTIQINSYFIFNENSEGKTMEPDGMIPNGWGLVNMLGNVAEFCSDWYGPDTYSQSAQINPSGPEAGAEYVIRGGSFKSPAADMRSAARDHTRTEDWLLTDPQMPKSVWWYSDCNFVGFRVVCEYNTSMEKSD